MCGNAFYFCFHGREAWCVPTLHDCLTFAVEINDSQALVTMIISKTSSITISARSLRNETEHTHCVSFMYVLYSKDKYYGNFWLKVETIKCLSIYASVPVYIADRNSFLLILGANQSTVSLCQ